MPSVLFFDAVGLAESAIPAQWTLNPSGWIMLVPKGDVPVKEQRLVQIVDDESLSKMAASFNEEVQNSPTQPFPGIRVDWEHRSYPKDNTGKTITAQDPTTAAAAWIQKVEVRNDGLWGMPKWTEPGYKAVKGGEFRMVSPAFLAKDFQYLGDTDIDGKEFARVRPLRFDTVALTNKPRMKNQPPITNEDSETGHDGQNKRNSMGMPKVMAALSLNADADEGSAASAVDGLKDQLEEHKQKLKDEMDAHAETKDKLAKMTAAHQALVGDCMKNDEAEAERVLVNDYGFEGETLADWKADYMSDKAKCLRKLSSVPKIHPTNRGTTTNADTTVPGTIPGLYRPTERVHNAATAEDPGTRGNALDALMQSDAFNNEVNAELTILLNGQPADKRGDLNVFNTCMEQAAIKVRNRLSTTARR